MATLFQEAAAARAGPLAALNDPARAITGPRFDALFFWGAPVLALIFVWSWVLLMARLPGQMPQAANGFLAIAVSVLTYAHLIAVAPRAYLNREVFETHRIRLTVVPVALVAGLLLSPPLLVIATVVAVFWDVHHSAMQTFGLARIYDLKAGNPPGQLRRADLWMNWALYVGPLAAGGSLMWHIRRLGDFGQLGWDWLTRVGPLAEGAPGMIRLAGIGLWLVCVGAGLIAYALAWRRGYRVPPHKLALLTITAGVSIAAWGLAPPYIAFAAINLFHAVQYFAIVWTKEGGRLRGLLGGVSGRLAFEIFVLACFLFGLAYYVAGRMHLLLAPFIACSLLHFWFDGFVWSVRRRQV